MWGTTRIFTADVVMMDRVHYFIFTDDTAFAATDSYLNKVITSLQAAQNPLEGFQSQWKIKINPNKTQAIYFINRRSQRHFPSSKIIACGHEVESDEGKYLGLVLDFWNRATDPNVLR